MEYQYFCKANCIGIDKDCIGIQLKKAEIEHVQFGKSDHSFTRQMKYFIMLCRMTSSSENLGFNTIITIPFFILIFFAGY